MVKNVLTCEVLQQRNFDRLLSSEKKFENTSRDSGLHESLIVGSSKARRLTSKYKIEQKAPICTQNCQVPVYKRDYCEVVGRN